MTGGEKGDRGASDADETTARDPADGPLSEDKGATLTDSEAVERRVWRNILAVLACAILAAAIFADLHFLLGLILGSGLALLNYRWLHSSLRAILGTGSSHAPPGTSMKFIVRWLLIATLGWAANRTGYFDAVGILAGLFAPAAAVMIEAAYVTYKTIARGDGER
ncbi:MAG TPA: ATP synthase subunit I [Blastocatellia bacterium]|nr:ATP synthase subunit I [Blastocatellia bacterium]